MKKIFAALMILLLVCPSLCMAQSTGKIDFDGLVQVYFGWREGEVNRTGCLPDSGCYDGRDYSTFALSAARLRLKAGATDRISAQLTIDAARDPVIVDGFVDAFIFDWASLRVGQFTLPYGFENYVSRFNLMTGSRSLIARRLWDNGITSPYLRDIGIMLKGKYTMFNYEIAQVNGAGFSYTADRSGGFMAWGEDNNNSKDYVGRVWIGVPLFAGLGLSMYRGEWENGEERNSWAFDLYLDTGKVIFQTEYARGHGLMLDDEWSDTDHYGYHVLVGYRFIPLIEGLYKYDKFDPTRGAAQDTMRDHYFGVNFNFRRSSKLQISYVRRTEEPFDFSNDRLQAFMSAKF
jgi:hypothetical protein